MKFIKFLVVAICVLTFTNILTALEIGDKAPPLSIAKWVRGTPVAPFSKNNKDAKAYVIVFWATWSGVSANLMNFISRENFIFGKDGVVFVCISKESPKKVKDFLKKHPDANFSIGIDNKAETYAAYMQGTKGVPMFFIIGQDKKLIWKGTPFEANRVLVRVLNGTFDAEAQKQIVKYRKRIQKASQMLDKKGEIFYARKILKIDPTDRIALNIIINNYIVEGKEKKAVDFVRSAQKKAVGNKYIQREMFFLELSIIRSMNDDFGKKKLTELVESYSSVFNDKSGYLNSLVVVVSNDVPLSIMPLSAILNISKRAVKLAEANPQDKENLHSCLQSLARVYYYIGRLKEAVATQEKAIQMIGDTKNINKETALLMEAYYKEALSLYQQSVAVD